MPSRSRVLAIAFAVLLVGVAMARHSALMFGKFVHGNLSNPDSYYNLVALLDGWTNGQFPFIARDNAPHGVWMHWTLPYSWTLWQLHRPLVWLGIDNQQALLYAGGVLTLVCALLVAWLLTLAVLRVGTRRAAMVSGLVLATSLPFMGYASIDEITDHVFFMVPLAAAAACLLGVRPRREWVLSALGGVLLGVALWAKVETMPFIVGLVWIRMATRAQHPDSAPVWPMVLGLVLVVCAAWLIDPPPPTFTAWTLDRMSLAWVWLAVLLAGVALLVEMLVIARLRFSFVVTVGAAAFVLAAVVWLVSVPGALQGPDGLVPPDLRRLWWNHIMDLQPVGTAAQGVGFLAMSAAAAVLVAWQAWHRRSLWLAGLAFMALCYGALAGWHMRFGGATAVVAALAFGIGLGQLRAFSDEAEGLGWRQQCGAFLLTTLAVIQLLATAGLAYSYPQPKAIHCGLGTVAATLNRIPASTFLTDVFIGPELLYRTHHRVVAGPYHHDISGLQDNYHAWLDTSKQAGVARRIVDRRHIKYVLGCSQFGAQLKGKPDTPTLAQRVVSGHVPSWLKPVPWPKGTQTEWRLYRVVGPWKAR